LAMARAMKGFAAAILLVLVCMSLAPKPLSQQSTLEKLIRVKSVMDNVVWARAGKVYFIVPDPKRMKDMNNPMAAYDTAAAGIVYSKTNATQHFGFDSDTRWIEAGLDGYLNRGKPKLTNRTIVLLGGRAVNYCVKYFEQTVQITPVYFDIGFDVNGTLIYGFATNRLYTNESPQLVAYMTERDDENYKNLFVIESFIDNDLNKIYVLYGIGWKGTWAAGIYFKERFREEIGNLDRCCYVFSWEDKARDGYKDGYPQPDEITMVYAYPYPKPSG